MVLDRDHVAALLGDEREQLDQLARPVGELRANDQVTTRDREAVAVRTPRVRGRDTTSVRSRPAALDPSRGGCLMRPHVEFIHEQHPDVHIVCAAVDRGLNEHGFIVPGLGDAGDRLYGTK